MPGNKKSGKKQAIIMAVGRVLSVHGYEGATMKHVAAEAGVSPGLLHYYFKDKEEMLVEAMRVNIAWALEAYSRAFAGVRPGDDVAALVVDRFRALIADNPDYFNIFLECWPLLMHTTGAMREMNKAMFDQIKESVREDLGQLVQRGCIKPVVPLADLTALAAALLDGIGIQIQADPALAANEGFWKSLKLCLDPWLGRAEKQDPQLASRGEI